MKGERIRLLGEQVETLLDQRLTIAGARVARAIAESIDQAVRDDQESGGIDLGCLGRLIWRLDRGAIQLMQTDAIIDSSLVGDAEPANVALTMGESEPRRLNS